MRAETGPGRPLFTLGVLTVPFENLWFAPSKGWAAIAPLLLFLYVLRNARRVPASIARLRPVFAVVLALLALSGVRYLSHPPVAANLLDAARSLFLGLTCLVAIDLRCRDADDLGPTVRLLGGAYLVALLFGVVQWIAIRTGWDGFLEFHRSIAMRDVVRRGRVQFGFTEPAFAAMHVFGVMLPLCLRFRSRPEARPLLVALVGFVVFGLATRFSLRFVVEGLLVLSLAGAVLVVRRRPPLRVVVPAALALLLAGAVAVEKVPRLKRIVAGGVYADESLAARWFRVRAAAAAWRDDPAGLLFGYGLGNLWVPLRAGHAEASAAYDSSYRDELEVLAQRRATSVLSLPVRLVCEFGLLATLALTVLLFDRRRPFVSLLIPLVYLTFDSYAFYALWLHVHALVRAGPVGESGPARRDEGPRPTIS